MVRACVAGLLRASKIRIQSETGDQLSAVRDAGVRDVIDKERGFKAASIYPVGEDTVGLKGRARICKFFEDRLGLKLDRENDAIADAVSTQFPVQMARLREVFDQLRKLPGNRAAPAALVALEDALGRCYKLVRQTEPTVREVARQLDALNDGLGRLAIYAAELTPAAIDAVRHADEVARYQLAQLQRIGQAGGELAPAAARIEAQLAAEAPWRGIAGITGDLPAVVDAYRAARRALLAQQEAAADAARGRVKRRDGFATLTAHNATFERSVLQRANIGLANVFDTLTASRRIRGPMNGGHSLAAVCRRELDKVLDKTQQTSDWTRRPLTDAQLAYAALDVEVLVQLYDVFSKIQPALNLAPGPS